MSLLAACLVGKEVPTASEFVNHPFFQVACLTEVFSEIVKKNSALGQHVTRKKVRGTFFIPLM